MKWILFLTLEIPFLFLRAQKSEPVISMGVADSIYSQSLKENRQLWIHVPPTDTFRFPEQKFPVIYLLDANAYFPPLVSELDYLSNTRKCPKMIVVGIPNETLEKRTRDLASSPSGGTENFAAFFEKELMPYIQKKYPALPSNRTIIGHSDGGQFAVNMLLNHPDLFDNYVVLDPSLWWDSEKFLKQSEKDLAEKKFEHKNLFLAIANVANKDTALVKTDTSALARHTQAILQFKKYLAGNRSNGLVWSSKYYPEEDHGTVPIPGEFDAMRFFFKGFKFEYSVLYPKEVNAEQATSLLMNHYAKYNLLPPEQVLNALGYDFLNKKLYDKSQAFFELERKCYPKSSNAADSLGDCYAAAGEKSKAIDCYAAALKLKFYPETKEKLEKLKNELKNEKADKKSKGKPR